MSAAGVITLRKAERRAEIPFAMIPFLFGIQQIIEGMVWLSFRFEDPLINSVMTNVYSLFSHVLWPIFVPFAMGLLEPVPWRKKTLSVFLLIGIMVGLYLLYFMVQHPITSQVAHHNIVYSSPQFANGWVIFFYCAATTVSCFFSSHKVINIFGAMVGFSAIVAQWFFTVSLGSVWCFFAAIISFLIYLHFKYRNLPVSFWSRIAG